VEDLVHTRLRLQQHAVLTRGLLQVGDTQSPPRRTYLPIPC
jgi:hypothetical protein